jgi:hypothetical protein
LKWLKAKKQAESWLGLSKRKRNREIGSIKIIRVNFSILTIIQITNYQINNIIIK